MATDWDIVIAGGGLAGLSLAVELAQPEFAHLRILVLEKRTHYLRDRTWSYWSRQPHRFSGLERKRWNAWRVAFDGQHVTQNSDIAYCTMDADAFYGYAQTQIASAPHICLRMGTSVKTVSDAPEPTVLLDDGSSYRARWVMDARPTAPPKAHGLCQHFMGWEIETPEDCFDDTAVDLMDFQSASIGLHFLYVLPYSPRQALIETTWMSAYAHQPDYAEELRHYLTRRFGLQNYKIVYREQGCLDLQAKVMNPRNVNPQRQVIALGRRAGTLRSSTGFAFLETIAEANRIAKCFANKPAADVKVQPYQRDTLDAWMDKIFCEGVMSDWRHAPEFFMAMFKGVSAETLVAFLSGRPTPLQRLQVSLQLPKAHFLRAAARVLRN